MISIASPHIGPEEIAAVNDVLRSGRLAQGPKVAELEAAFAEYCGTKYAVALNSGTAAIHAALYAAGVGVGDEVITVPFSFIATINPIIMVGATPKLVDIDPETFNIDVAKVEAAITSKTKAILPVHLYGQPVDMRALRLLADKYELIIIEDACQAVGAEYSLKRAGKLGDMGCFSFYATKNIMCGEGGMVTTDNEQFAQTIRQMRQHGMTGAYEYAHMGYNYRMSELHAAIAVEQMHKIKGFTAKRQHNAKRMAIGLKDVVGLELPIVKADRSHVYHQFTVRIKDSFGLTRDALAQELKELGVAVGIYYPKGLHTIPHIASYGYSSGDFPVTELAAKQVLSLPIHQAVEDADVDHIVTSVKKLAYV